MRNLFVMVAAMSMFMLGGCYGIQTLGTLGETGVEAYDIRAEHAGSPSWSAGVLTWLGNDGERRVAVVAPSADPGLTAQVFQAGSHLGSAYLWGASFDPRPDTYSDNSTTTTSSDSESSSGAAAGAIGVGVGNGGAGGHGGNGHAGGHGQGNNPGHDHDDDD